MKRREFHEQTDIPHLKLTTAFLNGELSPTEVQRHVACELYVELVTRITTQPLPDRQDDEKAAPDIASKFIPLTRKLLQNGGPARQEFPAIAIPVLDQFIRQLTSYWHKLSTNVACDDQAEYQTFRNELAVLQITFGITRKHQRNWNA